MWTGMAVRHARQTWLNNRIDTLPFEETILCSCLVGNLGEHINIYIRDIQRYIY